MVLNLFDEMFFLDGRDNFRPTFFPAAAWLRISFRALPSIVVLSINLNVIADSKTCPVSYKMDDKYSQMEKKNPSLLRT